MSLKSQNRMLVRVAGVEPAALAPNFDGIGSLAHPILWDREIIGVRIK